MTKTSTERRSFGVHPAIIMTLMREQAGSADKAIAELVMNSVDAGASRVDITIGRKSFVVQDDGRGFSNRYEIEGFFEVFGAPHKEEDAYQKYARFRVGRGQIMSYARTKWRSGPFEMSVDMESCSDVGYDLATVPEVFPGCRIEGDFYQDYYESEYGSEKPWGISATFRSLIGFIPIPVFVNGRQCNTLPSQHRWDFESDSAWFEVSREMQVMRVYNRGVLVEELPAAMYGMGGVLVSKMPLMVNMARNSIIRHKCPLWPQIVKSLEERFALRITKAKRLNPEEAAKLLNDLMFTDVALNYNLRLSIRKIKFIPDVFGELQSPDEFLAYDSYTLYDGKNRMVAERVHKQKRVGVVVKSLFWGTDLDPMTSENMHAAVHRLRSVLSMTPSETLWIPFDVLVQQFDGTHDFLDDDKLDTEQLMLMTVLRGMNYQFASTFGGRCTEARRLIAGKSDTASGWTDGKTYIAIDAEELSSLRDGAATRIVSLIAHEYLHTDPSELTHDHDYHFYQKHHNVTMSRSFGQLVELLTRKYVAGLCKIDVVPSKATKYHVRQLAAYEQKLATRKLKPSSLMKALD